MAWHSLLLGEAWLHGSRVCQGLSGAAAGKATQQRTSSSSSGKSNSGSAHCMLTQGQLSHMYQW
jgi:hypothetical protein